MAPVAVEMIGKKKRRRGKKGEVSASSAALGVRASKQRKRRLQREPTGARCMYFFFSLSLI
jgi:hypothetical protein